MINILLNELLDSPVFGFFICKEFCAVHVAGKMGHNRSRVPINTKIVFRNGRRENEGSTYYSITDGVLLNAITLLNEGSLQNDSALFVPKWIHCNGSKQMHGWA